jgi:hypothetical protein
LIRPSHRKVHQAPEAEAARQSSVDRCVDEGRGKEGERHRQADRTLGPLFAVGNGLDCSAGIFCQFVKPSMGVAERVDENLPRFGSHRPHCCGLLVFCLNDLATPIRGWLRPGNDQHPIRRSSHRPIGELNLQRGAADRDALDCGTQVAARIEGVRRRGDCGAVVGSAEIAAEALDALPSNRTLALRNASTTRRSISIAGTRAMEPASCFRPCRTV